MRTWTIVLAGVIGSGQNATIPDCYSGELLVSKGQGQFECVSPSRALALSNCQSGDFVTSTGSELKCDRPQNMSWNIKALLPSCSSGQVLVSEGFGSWRCVTPSTLPVLPSCSSGEILVSDGGSSWKCASRK